MFNPKETGNTFCFGPNLLQGERIICNVLTSNIVRLYSEQTSFWCSKFLMQSAPKYSMGPRWQSASLCPLLVTRRRLDSTTPLSVQINFLTNLLFSKAGRKRRSVFYSVLNVSGEKKKRKKNKRRLFSNHDDRGLFLTNWVFLFMKCMQREKCPRTALCTGGASVTVDLRVIYG